MTDRYISEKTLIENIAKIEDLRTLSTKTIGEAISNTPTADVVEVVRCVQCKYWKTKNGGYCEASNALALVNNENKDFCSYGQRK